MGIAERKAREKEELRHEILSAARELFVEQGYESVSMRKIAEKIEYSPTTIYLHFRDKADLFDCLCADTFDRLLEYLEAPAGAGDPVEGLRAGLRAYIDFGLAHPVDYRVTFMLDHHDSESCARRQETGCRAFGCLRAGVQACVDAGRFQVDDVDATSQALWAAVHGLTSLFITCHHFPWVERERLIEHLLDTLMKGLSK